MGSAASRRRAPRASGGLDPGWSVRRNSPSDARVNFKVHPTPLHVVPGVPPGPASPQGALEEEMRAVFDSLRPGRVQAWTQVDEVEAKLKRVDPSIGDRLRGSVLDLQLDRASDDASTESGGTASSGSLATHEPRWSYQSVTDADGVLPGTLKAHEVRGLYLEDLAQRGVGAVCVKGARQEQQRPKPNQDSFVCVGLPSMRLFGVFDGHGRQGHHVSDYVKDHLPKLVLGHPDVQERPCRAFLHGFREMQELLAAATACQALDCRQSGTTATVVLQLEPAQFLGLPEHNASVLVVAHVGDSRCVIAEPSSDGWVALDLTADHKASLAAERQRIEQRGGQVLFDKSPQGRVYSAKPGVRGPGLNMSRAFGDLRAQEQAGITAVPETSVHVTSGPGLLLLCSDGVWDFISSQEAVDLIAPHAGVDAMAQALADEARARWQQHRLGSVDDITALVVRLEDDSSCDTTAPVAGTALPGSARLEDDALAVVLRAA